jgi:excisionase family DNA binding protein
VESDSLSLVQLVRLLNAEHGFDRPYMFVWKSIAAGRIPAHQVGNRWRVRPDDVPQIVAKLAKLPVRSARGG